MSTLINGDFPKIVAMQKDESTVHFELEITQDLDWFRGHFPDQPILPGVVQLHWAVCAAREYLGLESQPTEIKRLKFKSIVTPPRTLDLTLAKRGQGEVDFQFATGDDQNSQGLLVFGTP